MDEGLKKRLVGAAVLASLAVIFVPMLIEEPQVTRQQLREIPPPPERTDFASSMLREEVVRPQPVRVDIPPVTQTSVVNDPEPVIATVAVDSPAEPEAGAPAQTVPTPEPEVNASENPVGKPEPAAKPRTGLTAWIVQVGSFSNRENADKLIAKLREAGFQAPDADRVELRGKIRYRVRVGPMVEKEKAEALLPQIDKVSGTKGQVLRFH